MPYQGQQLYFHGREILAALIDELKSRFGRAAPPSRTVAVRPPDERQWVSHVDAVLPPNALPDPSR